MTNITDRVIEEITKLGTTNREIATKLGVTHQAVRFWINGLSVPKPQNLAQFHAAGLDVFYIITGKRVGDIITKDCRNCRHFDECDDYACHMECETCSHNSCRDCHDFSGWLWEGYAHAKL